MTPGRFVLELLRPGATAPSPWFADSALHWRETLEFARRKHAALPFLHRLAKTPLWESLPGDISQTFEAELSRERMRLALLDEEFAAATSRLADATIPWLALKGMDLGRRYYPDRMLRPMTDVDLLVPEERFTAAVRALRDGGYRVIGSPFADRRRIELSRYADGLAVELHWAPKSEPLWHRATDGGLHPQDLLLYLIRHSAVQHRLESPIWLNDVHFVLARETARIDWEQFVADARRQGAVCASWFVFALLDRGWGSSAPTDTLATLQKRAGLLRTAWLSRKLDAIRWFSEEPRSDLQILGCRYLLAGSAIQLLRHARRRGSLGFRSKLRLQ